MKNLDRLIRKLDKLGGNAHEAVKKGVGQATKLVQGDAKMLAPRDTGDLAQSIIESVTFDGDEVVGKVSTNIEWGSYVEFGTGQRGEASNYEGDVDLSYRQDWAGMDAQPYMYPAINQNRKEIPQIVANEVKKEIKRLGG